MYNLFGDFLSYTYGPASESIKNLIPLNDNSGGISERGLKYFKIINLV